MKLILPMGGLGKRVRPHSYSQPKPLLNVAGKPILAHILDELSCLDLEQIIFVVAGQPCQIAHFMDEHYPRYSCRWVEQTEPLGQSHAIFQAKDLVENDALIIFPDTIFKTDLTGLTSGRADGVLHLKAVADPARFGVGLVDGQGYISGLVEKPARPVSNLAVVGVYYFRQAQWLFEAIAGQMDRPPDQGSEYYLADAINRMVAEGARFRTREIELWQDCGTIEALLETNRTLLARLNGPFVDPLAISDTVIIPPVFIGPGAKIERSVIGPHVTIMAGAHISDSVVKDSIINEQASVRQALLGGTIVGRRALIEGTFQRLNLGDDCYLGQG